MLICKNVQKIPFDFICAISWDAKTCEDGMNFFRDCLNIQPDKTDNLYVTKHNDKRYEIHFETSNFMIPRSRAYYIRKDISDGGEHSNNTETLSAHLKIDCGHERLFFWNGAQYIRFPLICERHILSLSELCLLIKQTIMCSTQYYLQRLASHLVVTFCDKHTKSCQLPIDKKWLTDEYRQQYPDKFKEYVMQLYHLSDRSGTYFEPRST